jgi:hypothetical protein
MFNILLICFYVFLFSLLIKKSSSFRLAGFSYEWVVFIFIIKVAVGIVYGIIHNLNNWGGDTYWYFVLANEIYNTLFEYPGYYISSFVGFRPEPPIPEVFLYPPINEYIEHFGVYFIVHIHAIVRIFSFGYYDVHVVFMAFISTIAGINFYKVFKGFSKLANWLLLLIVFFTPSVLFWTTGFHKDTFVFLGISIMFLGVFYAETNKRTMPQNILYIIAGFCLISSTRVYLAFLAIPALLVWLCSFYLNKKRLWVNVILVYFIGIASVSIYDYSRSDLSILGKIAHQHSLILGEVGISTFYTPSLEPTVESFVSFMPNALTSIFFRPLLTECHGIRHLMAWGEIMLFWLLFIVMLAYYKPQKWNGMLWMMACYLATNFLLIGYLTTNSGTLVRYRSLPLELLIFLICCHIDYTKLEEARIRLHSYKL